MRWMVVLAVLGLIVGIVWLTLPESGVPEPLAAQAADLPGPNEAPEPQILLAPVSEASQLRADVEERATELQTITVRGRLERVDAGWATPAPLNGSLTAVLWKGSSSIDRSLQVVGGSFELRIAEDIRQLAFHGCILNGQLMVLEQEVRARYPVDPKQEIVLRCRPPRGLRLLVRDAASRADLSDVSVRRIDDSEYKDLEHPGNPDAFPEVASGTSPLELTEGTENRGSTVYFIGAPGWAWKRLEVDPLAGGEREVLLEQGGILDLEILGSRPAHGLLRLRRLGDLDSRPLLQRPLPKRGGVRIADLPTGEWMCTVELGKWFRNPRELGSSQIALAPGEITSSTIELEELPELPLAPLSGSLRVPAAWGFEPSALHLRAIDLPRDGSLGRKALDLVRDGKDRELWHWDAGSVSLGRHELNLYQLLYAVSLEVEPEGLRDLALEVPPPATVVVRAIDDATGHPLPLDGLLWACRRPPGVAGGGLKSADPEPGEDFITLIVPQTEITLRPRLEGYYQATRHGPITIASTHQEVVARMSRSYLLEAKFFDGEVPVPFDDSRETKITHLSGNGKSISTGGAEHLRLRLNQPGRYRVELPEIEGFEPVPPFEVDVGPDGVMKTIALRRR